MTASKKMPGMPVMCEKTGLEGLILGDLLREGKAEFYKEEIYAADTR